MRPGIVMAVSLEGTETPEVDGVPLEQFVVDQLGSKMQGIFEEWKQAKQPTEDEWLKDLRAYNSQYDADVLARIGNRSKIFVSLTHTKTMAAYSRIVDMLFSSTLKPWTVKETPVPEMESSKEIENEKERLKIEIMGAIQMGEISPEEDPMVVMEEKMKQFEANLKLSHKTKAREAARLMSEEIDDQLQEMNFETSVKRALHEMCIVGTGAVKGAMMKISRSKGWKMSDGTDTWELRFLEEPAPEAKMVSVFDLYPDPYSDDLNAIPAIFQRHVMTRTQFRALSSNSKFDSEIIEGIIASNPNGNHSDLQHEIERRRIGNLTVSGNSGRFEVLEYWGNIDGNDLANFSVEVQDRSKEYQANIWICAGRVIMARLNPTPEKRIPYQLVPFERMPHQLWGIGPPRMMRGSQATLNASARALLDNLGISSGPQFEINIDMLADGEDPNDIRSFKTWHREGGDPSTPMIRQFQPNSNSTNLIGVMNTFREYADEETSLPRYMHGEGGGGTRTSSGLSMLMGAANLSVKSIIKNIDDYLFSPLVHSFYDWNMKWNPRKDIKGDMRVIAQGSTSLVAREVQSERMLQFANMTSSEYFASKVNHEAILSEIARAMELPVDLIMNQDGPTEEDVAAGKLAQEKAQLDIELDKGKLQKLLKEAERAAVDAATMPMVRESESIKDTAVAQRAIADISLQQEQEVAPPPLPQSMQQEGNQAPPDRSVSSQMQFA
jgi:hypothetical protein